MKIVKAPLFVFPAMLCAALAGTGCAAPAAEMRAPTARTGASAQQAAEAFLDAFNALDAVRLEQFFADDVTMFFPSGPFPKERVAGKTPVAAAFARLFEAARSRGTTRLNISPLDLQVQDYGGFAAVSFHLRGNGNIGRRSILLRRKGGDWKIVHFHASALEEAGPRPDPS
jgi:ketosteroid isomerase-like protein